MRSALRLFRDAVPDRTASYLESEMKWLGSKFGAVRDLDAILLNLARYAGRIERFPLKKRRLFEDWIGKHRHGELGALCETLESPRYRTFEARVSRFLERPLPLRPRSRLAARPVQEAVPAFIAERFNAVCEQGRNVLARPKLKEFHRLRIRMKRLRYLCEFIAPAYNGSLDPFIERTVEIQDCLGELQDTVFARELIDSLRDDLKGSLVDPDLLFILGEMYQLQGEIAQERKKGFGGIWVRFSSEETSTLLRENLPGFLPPGGSSEDEKA